MQSAMLATTAAARAEGLDIFQAAAAGDVPRATELLNANPKLVRARSADGRTPLHYATANGKAEMVTQLGLKGADLSAGPETPLLAAVDFPEHGPAWDMSLYLLGNASDPNARRADGKTALDLARARGYDDIADMLLHRGAGADDPAAGVERVWYGRRFIQDIHGKPFHRDDTHGIDWTEINAFVVPAHGNFDKVKELLAANPDLLNTRASWDETAIEAAAHMGLVPMAEFLADRGAAVSTCTAVLLGQTAMVKEALAADRRSVRERGAHDFAIMAYTAFGNPQPAIAEMLLKAGATVQEKNRGAAPLLIAARKGYIELAEILLAHGADVNFAVKSNGQSVTALSTAIKAGQTKMAAFLRAKGAVG